MTGSPILFVRYSQSRRQHHAGIRYIPVTSKLRISLASVEGRHSTLLEFYSMADSSTTVRRIPILNAERCLAQYQLHPSISYIPVVSKLTARILLASVKGRYNTPAEFYSIADPFTNVLGIPILIAGGCLAECQLYAGIRYVPVASKLRISLAFVKRRHRYYPGRILLDS